MPNSVSRDDRIVEEDEDIYRSPQRRDRDRILYTREFRRLKDVTQVARVGESYLYHDRLTHSQKVAQVGGSLARIFRKREEKFGDSEINVGEFINPYTVEAACLAHDIGHPPFGHVAEGLLDDLVRVKTEDDFGYSVYGFEGNAQSFRIVTRLAEHREYNGEKAGLNLTRATLNAMQKYPWSRSENDDKWGYYPTENDEFRFARDGMESASRCVEAEIMDYADDLTYAIHDVDDFYRGGLIPLDQLFREATSNDDYSVASRDELTSFEDHLKRVDEDSDLDLAGFDVEAFFDEISTEFPYFSDHLFTPFGGTDPERAAANEFVSGMVGHYLEADSKKNPEEVYLRDTGGDLSFSIASGDGDSFKTQIEVLKQLTVHYVINNPILMSQQKGQKEVIANLFNTLYAEAVSDNLPSSIIPSPYRERLKRLSQQNPMRARIVADMISAMTEPQAVGLHKRLIGDSPGSLQDAILR